MRHILRLSAPIIGAVFAATSGFAGNESRFDAFPVSKGVFEVVADFSENSIYWCGAATYARAEFAVRGTSRLYVSKRPGASIAKPGEKAVQFSLVAPSVVDTSVRYSNAVDILGNSMSVTQALQTCTERSASG
ncbi:MAG: hypothetical protein AB8B51_20710 [Sedimentitalea sp.]